jgi:hypothetical protein
LIDRKTETIVARMDGGDLRVIPLSRYGHVQLGYAFTAHSLQGDTRESSYVLVGGTMQDRELSYVQMSRHRGEARIYAATEDVGKTLETMGEIMSRSRQKALAQEKRAEGLEIAPAADFVQNRGNLEEVTQAKGKPEAERRREQSVQAEPWFISISTEDRRNVTEALRVLERIADVSSGKRGSPHRHMEDRAGEIRGWVWYGQPIAEKLSRIPGLPLDAEIKDTLKETFRSLQLMTRAYEYRQDAREYLFQSMNIAREALKKTQPDLLTWELVRSVSHSNGNFDAIAKTIEQGGRVGKLWQYGEPGEHNMSVFTIRNLPGTFTAHADGIDRTSMSFDDRINSFGYGDPPDSRKVKEIEYDPAKIRAQQLEQQRAQAREIERQAIDKGHDYGGFSR